jgi:hypothetical protein
MLNRLKSLAAFVAIVWGVAGSFVVLDVLFLAGASRLSEPGGPLESLSLPAALQRSQVCRAVSRNPNGVSGLATADVRALAWLLGVRMGHHARSALIVGTSAGAGDERARESFTAQQRMVDNAAAERDRLASVLKVPPPAPFTPANQATVNIEFVPFVENDDNRTARALTTDYGSEACELYKMGAYWGFSLLVRAALPGEPNIYAREIAYYARRLEVPQSLWQPMVSRTPADAAGEALATDADAATRRVAAYLQSSSTNGLATPPK